MRTLIRCVAAQRDSDEYIGFFSRMLDHTYSGDEMAAYLVVRSLCRYGVPKRAWAIAHLPIGGRY